MKQFLYDWAPAAFDHPSLWKSRNRGFPVGEHIGWIGLDFRKRPGASLHIERTMSELSVVEGAFSDEELAAVCRGLAPAVPEARELIARTSLADLSYAARHVERIIEVPVGYFRHQRRPDVPVTLFNGEAAPTRLPGRSIRPPADAYRLDSTFVYGDVDDPHEVDFAYARNDDHGAYLRVLASRTAASRPGGIPYPPDLDQQPCSRELLSVDGRDVHYAFLDERWGPHEVVFQSAGENVMVLAKPAAWTDRAWFLDLVRGWA